MMGTNVQEGKSKQIETTPGLKPVDEVEQDPQDFKQRIGKLESDMTNLTNQLSVIATQLSALTTQLSADRKGAEAPTNIGIDHGRELTAFDSGAERSAVDEKLDKILTSLMV